MKDIIKLLTIAFLCVVVLFGGCFYFIGPKPPKEAKLIQNFNEHRAAFEELRDMLKADGQVRRVASYGVETTNSGVTFIPPAGNFPVDRYNKYLALLKQAGGLAAFRSEGEHANPTILVWRWGFAGESIHTCICWMEQAPTNQIAILDGHQSGSTYGHTVLVFRHIDQSWYLRADW